jgi:hypothetical protein
LAAAAAITPRGRHEVLAGLREMPHHATAAASVKALAFEPGNWLLPVPDFGQIRGEGLT